PGEERRAAGRALCRRGNELHRACAQPRPYRADAAADGRSRGGPRNYRVRARAGAALGHGAGRTGGSLLGGVPAGGRADRTGGEPSADLSASAQKLRGAELDGELVLRAIDEVPILAVLGAVAAGATVIRGAGELRVKESDRLAQMARGLRAMGAQVEELPDGLRIDGGRPLRGASIDAARDHRIALAFSVAALAADSPTLISGAEWA